MSQNEKNDIEDIAERVIDDLISNGYIHPEMRDFKIKQYIENQKSINSKDKE